MKELDLQDAVIDMARALGWRVAHFRPAKTERGWRTPVQADGAGFPDLVLVRDGVIVFAELKARRGGISVEQRGWLEQLGRVAVRARGTGAVSVHVWRPEEWLDGTIESVLRGQYPPPMVHQPHEGGQ